MNTKETLLEMKEYLDNTGFLSSSHQAFIRQQYENITGKAFTNRQCYSCYKDAFIEMYITINS